jgi:hypothetical protein
VPTITIAATLFINKFSVVSRRFAGARRDSNFGANSLSYKEILVAIWLEGQVEGQGLWIYQAGSVGTKRATG